MLNVAIVGFGKMGIFHSALLNAHPEVQVKAIVDTEQKMMKIFKKLGSGITPFVRLDEALSAYAMDAVVITTPQSSHIPILLELAPHQVHALVEKPLASNMDQINNSQLPEGVKERTAIGYVMRFHPAFNRVKRLLEQSVLGDIRSYRAHYYIGSVTEKIKGWRADPAIAGGGALITNASHLVDLLLWYFGVPEQVSGHSQYLYHEKVEDMFYATLNHRNGMTGTLETDWTRTMYRLPYMGVEIYGENGEITVDNDGIKIILFSDTPEFSRGVHHLSGIDLYDGVYFDIGGIEFSLQAEAFVSMMLGTGSGDLCRYSEAVDTQRIIDRLYYSARNDSIRTHTGDLQ